MHKLFYEKYENHSTHYGHNKFMFYLNYYFILYFIVI